MCHQLGRGFRHAGRAAHPQAAANVGPGRLLHQQQRPGRRRDGPRLRRVRVQRRHHQHDLRVVCGCGERGRRRAPDRLLDGGDEREADGVITGVRDGDRDLRTLDRAGRRLPGRLLRGGECREEGGRAQDERPSARTWSGGAASSDDPTPERQPASGRLAARHRFSRNRCPRWSEPRQCANTTTFAANPRPGFLRTSLMIWRTT